MHCVTKALSNQPDCDNFDKLLRRIIQRFDTFVFTFFYHTPNCDFASVVRDMRTHTEIVPDT